MKIEIHFTEGFSGETVELASGGRVLDRVTLVTRMQIGLASIVELSLDEGDEVAVTVVGAGTRTTFRVDRELPFVTIQFDNQQLEVSLLREAPGYL